MAHRYTEAAREYALYLAAQPDDAFAYAAAGQNALETDDLVEAARLLDRAMALAPVIPRFWPRAYA